MSNREANFFMTKKMLTQSSIHAIINNGKLSFLFGTDGDDQFLQFIEFIY